MHAMLQTQPATCTLLSTFSRLAQRVLQVGNMRLDLTAGPGARPLLPSPFQMQPRSESSGAQPSGATPVFPARMPDVSVGSLGWSRPYSPTPPFPDRSAFEGRPASIAFQRASDQVC